MNSGAEKARQAGYLCSACAETEGGKWPKDHRATFHGGTCPLCGKAAMLASWDDWNWPQSKLDKLANTTREI